MGPGVVQSQTGRARLLLLGAYRRRAGVALSLALLEGSARAGNEDELLLGNGAALSGGAIAATVGDGSALYYNPAGLARVEQDSVDVTASAFVVRRYELPALLSAPSGERARGDFTEIVSAPSALTYVRRLSPVFAAGVGVFVPRSLDLVLRSNLRLVAEGRSAEWLAALGVRESRYLATFGMGFRISPRLRIGASLHAVYDAAFLSSLFAGGFVSGAAPSQDEPPSAFATDGFFQQHVLINQVNVGLQPAWGVQWDATAHLRCGFAMRAPGVSIFSFRHATSAASQAEPTLDLFVPVDEERSRWQLERMLALRTTGAVAYAWGHNWVAVDVDYQSSVHSARLDLDREPVVNARVGARFQIDDTLAVGVGLFSDRSNEPPPVGYPDTRIDFYGGTAGFELRHDYRLASDQPRSALSFSSTVALRYAHGSGEVGGVSVDSRSPAPGEIASIGTPAVGVTVDELSLHVGSALYF